MANISRHIPPGHGKNLDLGGVGVAFRVSGEQTGGAFAVVEHPVEPHIIVEPHIHKKEDEISYVLSGTIWVRVGDQEIEAPTGSYILKPRGIQHTFWNPSSTPARIMEIISPAGFEKFFAELAALIEGGAEPDDERFVALSQRYGLTFDRSWIPDIEARFGPLRMV